MRDAATRRVVRRCDSRGSLRRLRSRCLALARRPGALGTRVAPIARASQLQSQGYPTQLTPAVGKIQGDAVCSGTVVAPTLVLTAAHCVWNRQTGTYHGNLTFGPGATWGGAAITYPYGRWQVHRPYVPLAYTQGDDSYDFALMEIAPSNGRYISEFVGAWDITPNIRWTPGTRVYMMGYPASGFWQTAAGFFGTGQYFCDASWKGDYFALGSGWEIYADCAMNGGASGGPWFVNVGGRWTIGGVNNKCYGPKMDDPKAYCTPYSYALRAAYFNDRIVTLWNDVQAQLTYR